MRIKTQSELPRFSEYMLNEIYKIKGDATKLSVEERLNTAYSIIKKNESLYKRFEKHDFFKSFLMVTNILIFQSDKFDRSNVLEVTYKVLRNKEKIQDSYEQMIAELEDNGVNYNTVKMTHRRKI